MPSSTAADQLPHGDVMRRSISSPGLLFASVSAILGSGWLFVAYYAAIIAGTHVLLSWLIGAGLIIIIAFTFAELSAMIPVTGSSSRIPNYTHGTVVSFLFAWMIWLSYAGVVPLEVQAILQYLSYFYPGLIHQGGALTHPGLLAALVLMLAISALNIFSLRWLIRCNTALTSLKLLIPIILATTMIFVFFWNNHSSHALSFMRTHPLSQSAGANWHAILAAVSVGGIVFAFNGFKQACEMAGEAKNPKWSLPIAVIGSVTLCLLIYLLLQFAFLVAAQGGSVLHGWAALHAVGSNSPLSAALVAEHLSYLLPLLYVGAVFGPLSAALMYMSAAGRSLYGMSKNDYIPLLFQRVTLQGNPGFAVLANFLLGMFLFLPLPGWNKMLTFLTALMAVTYSIAPVCLLALRAQAPHQLRPFKLPWVQVWSWIAFYACTLLIYWSGWDMLSKLGIALFLGLLVLLVYHFGTARGRELTLHWRPSIWAWIYFIGISVMSYCGNFGHGHEFIPAYWDFGILAVFCMIVLWLSQHYKLPAEQTQACLSELNIGGSGSGKQEATSTASF